MHKVPADGYRNPFPRIDVGPTMTLLITDSPRDAAVIYNDGPATVYLGQTGESTDLWIGLGTGDTFIDEYSKDDWWAMTLTSSGTVSGYAIR